MLAMITIQSNLVAVRMRYSFVVDTCYCHTDVLLYVKVFEKYLINTA
jgi:hypothetical protein